MIPAGKYEYTIKGKLGTKKGIIDFKEVGKNVTGVMYFGKMVELASSDEL